MTKGGRVDLVKTALTGHGRLIGWMVGLMALATSALISCGGEASATPTPPPPTSTVMPYETPSPDTTQQGQTPTSTFAPEATLPATSAPGEGGPALAWQRIDVAGAAPGARKDATLVYDDANNSLLLFGGRSGGQGLNDLWSFDLDSGKWAEVTAPGAPDTRWGHVSIFDSGRSRMVVFSGQRPGGFLNDTWVFDTVKQEWREISPDGDGPSKRYGSCSGYDSENDLFYISHGFTASGRFDDTWAFDLEAERWTEVSPTELRPIERCLHRCAFDPESNSLFLFGGQSNRTPILGDLWRYDPAAKEWTDVSPEGESPSPRFFSSLVRDPESRRFILFGGFTGDGRKNDLWSYAPGEGWTGLAPSATAPEARSNHSGAFVPNAGAYYVFGGVGQEELGDLWLLKVGQA